MCELFAMSSRHPATVTLSLSELLRHGGDTGPHADGWGIAYYEGGDARLVRRGLVERRTSETDRRAVELRLTNTGRTTQTELEGCLRECGNELRDQLSSQEMFTAAAGLSILLDAMEQE